MAGLLGDATSDGLLAYKTPDDYEQMRSNAYSSKLSPDQQQAFAAWIANLGRAQGRAPASVMRDTYDYDLQGAFLAQPRPDARGHLTDQFKKPWHPTFSTESQYNGIDGNVGGQWNPIGRGRHQFAPGPTNMQHWDAPALMDYWRRAEAPAGNVLRFPPGLLGGDWGR